MSMAPNNPFGDPQNDQGYAQSPTPKKRGKGCLIGCTIAGVLCLMVCCGGGLMVSRFVSTTIAAEYQRQLTGNPVIVERIGEIESVQINWSATIEEAQKAGQEGESRLVFDIKGDKSSGKVVVDPNQSGGSGVELGSAVLVMPDGSRHPIGSAGPTGLEEMGLDELGVNVDDLIDAGDLDTGSSEADEAASVGEPQEAKN